MENFLQFCHDFFHFKNTTTANEECSFHIQLKTILFPFLKRNWMRLKDDNSGGDAGGNGSGMGTGFVSPRGDENAPDLYIPSMGLCSYVLLSALVFGNSGSFSPDIIQDLLVSCTFTQFLEVSAIKVGYYFLQAPCSWLDMIR